MMKPLFTQDDVKAAYAAWKCNCGPVAFAAITGLTLRRAREAMREFQGYTEPGLMKEALGRASVLFTEPKQLDWPVYGLVRLQWEGEWPKHKANRYTHWVGATRARTGTGIFDMNCLNNGSGWTSLEDWERVIVPAITGLYAGANGKWHITHAIEVRAAAADLRIAG